MIAYVVLAEQYECDEQPVPCKYRHQCEDHHRLKRSWTFYGSLTTKLGTAHGHLARITKKIGKYASVPALGYTGDVKLVVIDSDKLEPLWGDAETAAYKLGGVEAVKRLQKGLVAEQKANARAQVRADKKAAHLAAKTARKRQAA